MPKVPEKFYIATGIGGLVFFVAGFFWKPLFLLGAALLVINANTRPDIKH